MSSPSPSAAASSMEDDPSVAASAVEAAPQPPAGVFLDALPYLDTPDASTADAVRALLHEEMSLLTRTPDEYLADFLRMRGCYDSNDYEQYETPSLKAGFAALSNSGGRAPASSLDLSRYKLDAPALPEDTPLPAAIAAWRAAVDNAQAQLEHQSNRAVNLELLRKFGAGAWKIHNEQLSGMKDSLAQQVDLVRAQIEGVNRKRKSEQVALGGDLALLHNGFHALVDKNHEIEIACVQMMREMESKGIPVPQQLKTRRTEEKEEQTQQ